MSEVISIIVSEVVFNKDYYTRTESQSPVKVQEYAMSIAGGEFPPILLNQDNILLDGWHRWMAHKECGLETIDVEYLDTSGFVFDGKLDIHAIKRKSASSNFRHGQPQTEKELKKLIRDEYRAKMESLDQKGRAELKKDMAKDYSRSERYIRETTSRIDKDLKVELRETAFNMWMGCYDNQEIADSIGFSRPVISEFVNSIPSVGNGIGAESNDSSENPELAQDSEKVEAAAALEAARVANQEHRFKIFNEILNDILVLGVEESNAKAIVKAIADGRISHVKVIF